MNVGHFERWLRDEKKFAATTVYDTVQATKRLLADQGARGRIAESYRTFVTRIEAFATETSDPGAQKLGEWARAALPVKTAQARIGGRALREERRGSKRVARSIDDTTWAKLRAAIRSDPAPPARVLELMAATSLRVNDVLRITRDQLTQVAMKTGFIDIVVKGGKLRRRPTAGAEREWENLFRLLDRTDSPDVAHAVSPKMVQTRNSGGTGSYQAVRRCLLRHCKALEITEAMWTHRLRRTVLVRAHVLTKDKLAVRDLADHEPAGADATDGYLKESVPARVAELQRKLNEDA